MRLGLKIAVRFLKSNKGQTLLIVLGIAIGVSVQIFIGSLIQGLQKGLIDKTVGNSPQITVSSATDENRIGDYNELVKSIQTAEPDIKVVSEALDNAAFLEYSGNSQSILIRGFQTDNADGIYNLYDRIEEGTFPRNSNEIILGIDLKDEYSLELNEKVTVKTFDQRTEQLTVVGFFDLKVASLNTGWGITTLDTAQKLFDTGDVISSIEIKVEEDAVFEADEIAASLQGVLSDEYKIENWKAQNESLLSGLQGQDISSYMIQVFVMVSVVLAIASVLAITVIQKSRQIGILKAMGIRNSSTSYIFLFEGLILGVFGAIAGILLGLGLSFAFTKFALNPDGTPVIDLYINYSFIVLSGAIAIVASILAALMPALRSSKLNPIDIIRDN